MTSLAERLGAVMALEPEAPALVASTAALADGAAFVGTSDGTVHAVELADGAPRCSARVNGFAPSFVFSVSVGVPVGALVGRGLGAVKKAQHRRAERKARTQVQKELAEFLAQQASKP